MAPTCQYQQGSQPTSLPELNIGVEAVTNHDGTLRIKLVSVRALNILHENIGQFGHRNVAYFALMQSSMVLAGFPMLMGALPSAYVSGALMEPAPGRSPSAVGYVLSVFVARNAHPGLRIR